jgi:hypothetical protein
VTADGAEEGSFVTACPWTASLKEVKACYEKVKETQVGWEAKGGIEELGKLARQGRTLGLRRFWEWHLHVLIVSCVSRVLNLKDLENDCFPRVKATSTEEFVKKKL